MGVTASRGLGLNLRLRDPAWATSASGSHDFPAPARPARGSDESERAVPAAGRRRPRDGRTCSGPRRDQPAAPGGAPCASARTARSPRGPGLARRRGSRQESCVRECEWPQVCVRGVGVRDSAGMEVCTRECDWHAIDSVGVGTMLSLVHHCTPHTQYGTRHAVGARCHCTKERRYPHDPEDRQTAAREPSSGSASTLLGCRRRQVPGWGPFGSHT